MYCGVEMLRNTTSECKNEILLNEIIFKQLLDEEKSIGIIQKGKMTLNDRKTYEHYDFL